MWAQGSDVGTDLKAVGRHAVWADGHYTGIYGATDLSHPNGAAGEFHGDLLLLGTICFAKSLRPMDHPQDPENRLLEQAAVEAPELLTLYRGKAQLDERGEATVAMPSYFVALTREDVATVNLTPIGRPAAGAPVRPGGSLTRGVRVSRGVGQVLRRPASSCLKIARGTQPAVVAPPAPRYRYIPLMPPQLFISTAAPHGPAHPSPYAPTRTPAPLFSGRHGESSQSV